MVNKLIYSLIIIFTMVCTSYADVIEIPFELDNGLIIIEVELDGKKDKFLFDTGTNEIIVHNNNLEVNITNSVQTLDGYVSAESHDVKVMKVGELYRSNVAVTTMDLSHVNDFLNKDVGGMIGASVFAPANVMIDYNAMKIVLDQTIASPSDVFKSQLAYSFYEGVPMAQLEIDGAKCNVLLDSGATSHFFDAVLVTIEAAATTVDVVTVNGKTSNTQGKISNVLIGNKNIESLSAINKDFSSFNEGQDLKVVGLLSLKKLATDGQLYFDTQDMRMYF